MKKSKYFDFFIGFSCILVVFSFSITFFILNFFFLNKKKADAQYSRPLVSSMESILFPAQFICLCYGRDDVREDVFFAKFLNKAHFGKVGKDIVVYTAEDNLYIVFL